MKKYISISFCFLILLLIGCGSSDSSDSVEEAVAESKEEAIANYDESADEFQNVSFSEVSTIISNNCSECHGDPTQNDAPMSLVSHSDIFFNADNIIIRLSLDESNGLSMPQNKENLTEEEISTIKQWVKAGKPNN